MDYYKEDFEKVLTSLETTHKGITNDRAEILNRKLGPNELTKKKRIYDIYNNDNQF